MRRIQGKGQRAKGQTVMEFALLFFVAVAAMLSMSVYVKRALQGSWRGNADTLSAQYDAKGTTSHLQSQRDSVQYTVTDSVDNGDVIVTTTETDVVDDSFDRTGTEKIEPMGELWN
jgi:hypothetical protein